MCFGNIVFITLSPVFTAVERKCVGSIPFMKNRVAGILFVRKNIFHRSKLYPIFLGKLLCAHAIQIVRKNAADNLCLFFVNYNFTVFTDISERYCARDIAPVCHTLLKTHADIS